MVLTILLIFRKIFEPENIITIRHLEKHEQIYFSNRNHGWLRICNGSYIHGTQAINMKQLHL